MVVETTQITSPLNSKMYTVVDGIKYEFTIIKYYENSGYAPILITDTSTGEVYHSDGYFELNGHIFISKWKNEYNPMKDQWIDTRELEISVD